MTDLKSLPVLTTDLAVEVVVPVVSQPGLRSPGTLNAVGEYLALQPRFVRRDVDGLPGDETFCNFLVREALRMLGLEVPRMKANEWPSWFRSTAGLAAGWTWVPLWVARELSERGAAVVPTQPVQAGHGHVALLQASRNDSEYQQALRVDSAWMCQAGATNFAHGMVRQGFRSDLPVQFFAHP